MLKDVCSSYNLPQCRIATAIRTLVAAPDASARKHIRDLARHLRTIQRGATVGRKRADTAHKTNPGDGGQGQTPHSATPQVKDRLHGGVVPALGIGTLVQGRRGRGGDPDPLSIDLGGLEVAPAHGDAHGQAVTHREKPARRLHHQSPLRE